MEIPQIKVCKNAQIRIYNKKMGAEARRKGELKTPARNPLKITTTDYYEKFTYIPLINLGAFLA